jgi:hypothetical protein
MYEERKLADALINACTLVATDNLKTLCTKYGADVIGFISGCLDKNMKIEAIPALCKFAGLGKYDLVKNATAEFMVKAYPSVYALKCSLGYKLINIMEKRSQAAGEAPMPPLQQGPMPPGPEAMPAQGSPPVQGAGNAGANLPPHVSNLVSKLSDMSVEDLLSTLDELAALGQTVMQGLTQNPQAAQQIGPIGQLVGLGLLGVVQTMTAGQQAAPPSGPAGPAPEVGGEAAAPAGPPPGPAAEPAAPLGPPPEAGGPGAGEAGGGIQLPPGAEQLTFA